MPLETFDRLAMRLQRDGWMVRFLPSFVDAQALLGMSERPPPAPALVLSAESVESLREDFAEWAKHLSDDTHMIFGAYDEPASSKSFGGSDRFEVRRFPFSESDLREWKEVARRWETNQYEDSVPAQLDSFGRPRLLVVDDLDINQILASELLRSLGYEVDQAHDGREALEYCQQFRPSAVLMDLHMPVMDGIEATTRLRGMARSEHWPRLPIFAVTTEPDSDQRAEFLASGADAFLQEPLVLCELEVQLKTLL